ncbi:MAG: hypothetical protein ACTHJQ_01410 [Rhizobiaceae bacterium]
MRPYHPANLKWQPFPHWRVIALSWVAKALGVSFHVHGIPFGAVVRQERHSRSTGTIGSAQ